MRLLKRKRFAESHYATGLPLTTGVTGTLPVANGGTNLTSFTSGGVVYASSGSALATGSALTFDGTNMGIGGTPVSSSGYTALTLNNATNSGYVVLQKNASTVSDWYVSGGTEATFRGVGVPLTLISTGANYIRAEVNGSERLRITSAGNVGIGTSAPVKPLHIISSSGPQILMEPSLGSGDTELMIGRGYSLSGTPATVGTKSFIQCAFEGSDDNAYSPFGYVTTAVGNRSQIATAFYIETKSAGSSTPSERMRIDSSGNLLVGTTTPTNSPNSSTSKFVVSGDFTGGFGQSITDTSTNTAVDHYMMSFNLGTASGNQKGYIQFVGASGLILYATTSDQRLKTDLGVVTNTSVIDNLLIHDYTWKESGVAGRGVFAQEAYEVMPNAVGKGKDAPDGSINRPWGVDYSKFIPDLIVHAQQLKKQVQEQQAIISAQATVLESLKARLDAANL